MSYITTFNSVTFIVIGLAVVGFIAIATTNKQLAFLAQFLKTKLKNDYKGGLAFGVILNLPFVALYAIAGFIDLKAMTTAIFYLSVVTVVLSAVLGYLAARGHRGAYRIALALSGNRV